MKKNFRKIQIRRKTFSEWLILFVFIMPFLLPTFLQLFKFPEILKYSIDVAWVLAFVVFLVEKRKLNKGIAFFLGFLACIVLYTVIVYLFNYQSVLYYLWGARNNFRFYIVFVLFAALLDEEQGMFLLKLMDGLFIVNFFVVIIQYFFFGYNQDFLGGIFGCETGSNGYMLAFMTIVISKSLLLYMSKKEKMLICMCKCMVSFVIAVLSELKVYFLIFILMVLIAMLLTKFSWRKVLILALSAILFGIAGMMLPVIFGANSNLSFERITELIFAENYATEQDLGRFTAIPIISQNFLTDIPSKLFGLGLGNCDSSSLAIFNTPFYNLYGYLHYAYFSTAFWFLELGFVGLILCMSFYIFVFVFTYKNIKYKVGNLLFSQMALMMAVLSVIFAFYNCMLRHEIAYMTYFVLALPFISTSAEDPQLLN